MIGATAIRDRIGRAGAGYLLADAIDEADQHAIGHAVLDHPLVSGASGLAAAVAEPLDLLLKSGNLGDPRLLVDALEVTRDG